MSRGNPEAVTIRRGNAEDLPQIHDLLQSSLAFDKFSKGLLEEKLLRNPHPERAEFNVLVAQAGGQIVGVMQSVHRTAEGKGWLGLFGVRQGSRGRGVAGMLFDAVKELWSSAGIQSAEALAIPGNYFIPGIDPRYTSGLCFLERVGFVRFKDCVNMIVELDHRFETASEIRRLEEMGIEVRRARMDDGALLEGFFASDFGAEWLTESELAMKNDPAGLHIAIRDGKIIAFSAHSSQNREWGFFGPMGTTPAARGTGIGRVLLWLCLNDLREAGHRTSVIPWVGPIGFYSRHANAYVDRVFWRYRMELS